MSDRSRRPSFSGSHGNTTNRRPTNTSNYVPRSGLRPNYSTVDEMIGLMNSFNFGDANSSSPRTSQTSRGTVGSSARPSVTATPQSRRIVVSDKDIDDYVHQVVHAVAPTSTELTRKREICTLLQGVVRRVLPNAQLKIMGGVANNFALKNSDLDLCIVNLQSDIDSWTARKLDDELRKAGKIPEEKYQITENRLMYG